MTANEPMGEKQLLGPQTHRRTIQAALACLGLGLFLMFLSLGAFIFYAPLFFASFVLSIVAIAQGRTSVGVVVLLVTVVVPSTLWVGLVALRVGETADTQKEKRLRALAAIKFEDVKGYVDGNFMYLKGKVRNSGIDTVNFIKIRVEWLDGRGTVLDTDYTYAVSSEGLRPGTAKSFSIMTEADSRMKQYRYFVMND